MSRISAKDRFLFWLVIRLRPDSAVVEGLFSRQIPSLHPRRVVGSCLFFVRALRLIHSRFRRQTGIEPLINRAVSALPKRNQLALLASNQLVG